MPPTSQPPRGCFSHNTVHTVRQRDEAYHCHAALHFTHVSATDDRASPQGADGSPRPAGEGAATAAPAPFPADHLRLLESAVVNSYDSIVITDAGGGTPFRLRILYVNQAFTRLTGYTPEEAIGRSPSILQGPASDHAEIERMRAHLARGEEVTTELINYRKSGTPYHAEARIMPIRDAAGRLIHWVGVQRDITARKEAAAERARLEERLREKQKMESLGVLAGGIAHDFNNLLTIILGNASLARMDSRSPEAVEQSLRYIESAALRAADLCRQMLAYSGKGRYVVRPVDLNLVVRETAELVGSSTARDRQLQLDLATPLGAIRADASQLQQVAMNLLLNAVEATEAGTGRIRVTTSRVRLAAPRLARARLGAELTEGEYLVLEVADNGCGIPREIQERIFDPFFTTKFTGRGLGLAAVLGIVRTHEGAIEIESEPGHGATFRLFFPACAEPLAPPPPADPAAPFAGTGRTLLIADDEPVLRETMRDLIQRLGYTVYLAADGAAAVELFRLHHEQLDLVLLDFAMPQLDGAAAFDAMHAIDPRPAILLMSGYSEDEALQRFAGRGLAGFIQKPFPIQTLLATLAAVLTRPR